jgi:hypothetical protein
MSFLLGFEIKTMMKLSIFALFFSLVCNAQSVKSTGTHFINGMQDKGWSNSNGANYTKAKFKSYTGSCYVILEVDETTQVDFQAFSEVKAGKLAFKLIDEQENIYFECNTNENCVLQKEITLNRNKKYRLLLTGENAKGNYEAIWEIKN